MFYFWKQLIFAFWKPVYFQFSLGAFLQQLGPGVSRFGEELAAAPGRRLKQRLTQAQLDKIEKEAEKAEKAVAQEEAAATRVAEILQGFGEVPIPTDQEVPPIGAEEPPLPPPPVREPIITPTPTAIAEEPPVTEMGFPAEFRPSIDLEAPPPPLPTGVTPRRPGEIDVTGVPSIEEAAEEELEAVSDIPTEDETRLATAGIPDTGIPDEVIEDLDVPVTQRPEKTPTEGSIVNLGKDPQNTDPEPGKDPLAEDPTDTPEQRQIINRFADLSREEMMQIRKIISTDQALMLSELGKKMDERLKSILDTDRQNRELAFRERELEIRAREADSLIARRENQNELAKRKQLIDEQNKNEKKDKDDASKNPLFETFSEKEKTYFIDANSTFQNIENVRSIVKKLPKGKLNGFIRAVSGSKEVLKDPAIQKLYSSYQMLTGAITKMIQGSRPSDYDAIKYEMATGQRAISQENMEVALNMISDYISAQTNGTIQSLSAGYEVDAERMRKVLTPLSNKFLTEAVTRKKKEPEIPTITTDAQFDALESGDEYIDGINNVKRTKP